MQDQASQYHHLKKIQKSEQYKSGSSEFQIGSYFMPLTLSKDSSWIYNRSIKQPHIKQKNPHSVWVH